MKFISFVAIAVVIFFAVLAGGIKAIDSTQENAIKQKIKSSKFKAGEMVEMKLDNREGMIVGVNTYTRDITYNIKFIYNGDKQHGHTLGSASRKKEFYTTEYHIKPYEIRNASE